MLDDLAGFTAKAFEPLHRDTPLIKELDDGDKMALVVLLKVYEEAKQEGRCDPYLKQMERVAKLATEAAAFGAKLESEVFQGPFADYLPPYTSKYRELPKQLAEFSQDYGFYMRRFGKSGHKAKIHADYWLVMASEFVRLKTGQYFDGHLAELYKAILESYPTKDLSANAIRKMKKYIKKYHPRLNADALDNKRIVERYYAEVDLSDLIRKKREYLKKRYQWQYDDALKSARRACDGGSFITE